MIFDINMDGQFLRKARYVAGGHTNDPPSSITYYSVVSIDSIIIVFTLSALNDAEIKAANIGDANLNANCRENIWTVVRNDFGSKKGEVVLVFHALYSLKSSGAA